MSTESFSGKTIFVVLSTLVLSSYVHRLICVMGQQENDGGTARKTSANSRPVNLFIINSEDNELANKSVMNSLKATREKYPDWLGKVVTVVINGTDPKDDLERICTTWDTALQEKTTEIPDLVLDTTRTGLGAETVNSFTSALGIPTLSGQFGQEGDLRHWRDLTEEQKSYLVQIMPPADLIPEAIRQLARQLNISNLAVIFGNNFVMEHKYKSLLLNVPTRHVIVRAKDTEDATRTQLSQLRKLDIVNFFVLGDEQLLTSILDVAQSLNFTGRKYGWYALTQDDFSPRCECKNLSLIFFKPEIDTTSQQRLGELVNRGLLPKPVIESAYYYDLLRIAVAAMKASINDASWPIEPKQFTCDWYDGSNTPMRNFDFLGKLKRVISDGLVTPTFADVTWGRKNGQHRASFNMSVSMIVISNGNAISTDVLGTWPANINEPWQKKIFDVIATNHIGEIDKLPVNGHSTTSKWTYFVHECCRE